MSTTSFIILGDQGTGHRIDTLWAFVSIDGDDDNEGVCAMRGPDGWMPLVASDEARVNSLRPLVAQMARVAGRPIKLVRFDQRTELETLT
jgi:hypothetical protein